MIVSGFWPTFLVGCFGGVMNETLNWYLRRDSPHIARYRKEPRYWFVTALMILVGGVVATLYGIEPKSALLVAQIGLTTPLIIKSLAQIPPAKTERTLGQQPSLIDFVAGR